MIDWTRLGRHLVILPWRVRRDFPASTRQAIEQAVAASEKSHGGQIVFAVEGRLELVDLLRGQTARQRAEEVFTQLRVWDTAANAGVLVFVLLADRAVEIIVDRGVPETDWGAICQTMESHFAKADYRTGALTGITAIGQHLGQHFPAAGSANELPDRPVLL